MRKVLGNALIGAALLTSPALASEVENHTALSDVGWKEATLSQVSALKADPSAEKILDSLKCSAPDRFTENYADTSRLKGLVSLDDIYNMYSDGLTKIAEERAKEAPSQEKLDHLKKSLKQYKNISMALGGNVYQHLLQQNDRNKLDTFAQVEFGINDSHLLEVGAGVKDYVTHQDLTVGDILYGGCLTTTDTMSGELTVISSNGNVNGLPLESTSVLINPRLKERVQYFINENRLNLDSNWASVDKYKIMEGNDLININTQDASRFFANLSELPIELSEEQKSMLNDLGVIHAVLHEIQHTQLYDELLSESVNNTKDGKRHYLVKAEKEIRADFTSGSKIAQFMINSDQFDSEDVDFFLESLHKKRSLDNLFANIDARKLKDLASSEEMPETLDKIQYRFENFEDGFNLIKQFKDTGTEGQQALALKTALYEVKGKYQVDMAIETLSVLIQEDPESFASLSDNALANISTMVVQDIIMTPEMQKMINQPESSLVFAHDGTTKSLATNVIDKFLNTESQQPKAKSPNDDSELSM